MVAVQIVRGDIVQTYWPVDAIITPVNLTGLWYGGVDLAIERIADVQYHRQLLQVFVDEGLRNCQVYQAVRQEPHLGNFRDVLFVGDDLTSPLNEVVLAGLLAADRLSYRQVAMSAMRTGKKMGVVEQCLEDVVDRMVEGFKEFHRLRPDSLVQAEVVVRHSDEFVRRMKTFLLD